MKSRANITRKTNQLGGFPLPENNQKRTNSWLLKRTMVEKDGNQPQPATPMAVAKSSDKASHSLETTGLPADPPQPIAERAWTRRASRGTCQSPLTRGSSVSRMRVRCLKKATSNRFNMQRTYHVQRGSKIRTRWQTDSNTKTSYTKKELPETTESGKAGPNIMSWMASQKKIGMSFVTCNQAQRQRHVNLA